MDGRWTYQWAESSNPHKPLDISSEQTANISSETYLVPLQPHRYSSAKGTDDTYSSAMISLPSRILKHLTEPSSLVSMPRCDEPTIADTA